MRCFSAWIASLTLVVFVLASLWYYVVLLSCCLFVLLSCRLVVRRLDSSFYIQSADCSCGGGSAKTDLYTSENS